MSACRSHSACKCMDGGFRRQHTREGHSRTGAHSVAHSEARLKSLIHTSGGNACFCIPDNLFSTSSSASLPGMLIRDHFPEFQALVSLSVAGL